MKTQTAVSTALPTIVDHLDGTDFIWAGSAYAIAATAILPMCGGLAAIFGRKSLLLVAIGFFAIGSILCGTARNLNMLIAGRGINCIITSEEKYYNILFHLLQQFKASEEEDASQ